jgi:hypothetical protein
MEFPDDVLSLIREFARPLKRRIISNYWVQQKIINIDEMAEQVRFTFNESFKHEHIPSPILTTPINCLEKIDGTWIICSNCHPHGNEHLSFNEKELLKWNGELEYVDGSYYFDFYRLEKDDIMYKQLLQNGRVIKEKMV